MEILKRWDEFIMNNGLINVFFYLICLNYWIKINILSVNYITHLFDTVAKHEKTSSHVYNL